MEIREISRFRSQENGQMMDFRPILSVFPLNFRFFPEIFQIYCKKWFISPKSSLFSHKIRSQPHFSSRTGCNTAMFSRQPVDVIKGLRKQKQSSTSFLTSVFTEIKDEVKSTDMAVKCNAVQKLFVVTVT